MLFNSLHFLLFLPIVVGLYYLLPFKFRWVLILFASCYFYMAFVPKYILVLFLIIIIDYLSGLTIEQISDKKLKRFYLIISLLSNIGLLAFFKYFNFLNENAVTVFHLFGKEFHPINLNILLPIGLSFHTFQSMSYTIEVYRGTQKAERHLGYFANYVLFFPQMVAGPIEKYETLGNELKKNVTPFYENFSTGFRLILFGLFVKMTIADNLAPVVNAIYADPAAFHSIEIILGLIFFSFQIYADFYGYSTIAIGAAKLLGVNLMTNFKTPYLAISIQDFWKRWHISLTSWFRNYVYFPLGGSKVNVVRWTMNILIIFLISGLWHGANWTFVIWGLLHGIMYLIESAFSKIFKFKAKPGLNFINFLLGIKTFFVVTFIWIFFRAENFDKAKLIIKSIFHNRHLEFHHMDIVYPVLFTLLIIISDTFFYNNRADHWFNTKTQYVRWSVYTMLLFCILCMSGIENLPFIYFQF